MRHGISGNKLGRNSSLRKATIRDIAKATLIQERICTTKAKAKEARKLVDRLITLGKKGSLSDKRRAFAVLCSHKLVKELFDKTAPRFKTRNGGYTRIITVGLRRGDNSQMAFLELTEKSEVVISKAKTTATAKKKDKTAEEAQKKETEKKKASVAKTKKEETSEVPRATKGKDKKGVAGGIKKMFNRKKV